jgi:hypothetical protein
MKEEKAIKQDQDEIEMTIRKSMVLPAPQQIRVFKMDSPMEAPVIICMYNRRLYGAILTIKCDAIHSGELHNLP